MAEKTLEQMREAVEEIRAKMAAAAREAGRDPAQVQLCAACNPVQENLPVQPVFHKDGFWQIVRHGVRENDYFLHW